MAGQPVAREREGRPPAPGARGYSWPPFEAGNEAAVRHGAYSPRKIDPLAEELVERLIAQAEHDESLGFLTAVEYRPAIWAWARAEVAVQLIAEWLAERGPLDGKGKPRPALDALHRFETLAANHRSRLGLDPLSRARLGRDTAAGSLDLARLFAAWAASGENGAQQVTEGGSGAQNALQPPMTEREGGPGA